MLYRKIKAKYYFNTLHPSLKRQLKKWRGRRRQKEAANVLEIPYNTYRAYEKGHRRPKEESGLLLSELLIRMKNNPE